MKFNFFLIVSIFLGTMFSSADITSAQNNLPKGFALYKPENFKEYPAFHGGAGVIKYCEYFGPADYKSNHNFFRVVILPPKTSIGEYKLTDSDETFVLLSGSAYMTINGHTGFLAGETLVPVKMGSSVGIFNPTDNSSTFIWVCSVKEKGKYNPMDLGKNLVSSKPEDIIPFPYIARNYYITAPGKEASHLGLPPGLIENIETVGFDYFTTGYTTRFFAVPPGASIGYHTQFTNEEHFFILSGTGRGTCNDMTVRMNPLDCLKCGVNDRHGIYNDGKENLWIFFTNQPMPGIKEWGKIDNNGDNLGGHEINWPTKK